MTNNLESDLPLQELPIALRLSEEFSAFLIANYSDLIDSPQAFMQSIAQFWIKLSRDVVYQMELFSVKEATMVLQDTAPYVSYEIRRRLGFEQIADDCYCDVTVTSESYLLTVHWSPKKVSDIVCRTVH